MSRSLHAHPGRGIAGTLAATALAVAATSCLTGVEGTRRVEMSRQETVASRPSAEDILVAPLTGEPLADWRPGKRFVVLDDRAALIFDSRTTGSDPLSLHLGGAELRYVGTDTRITPQLDTVRVITFADNNRQYHYELRPGASDSSMALPMLTDLDPLIRLDSMLRGKTLYVKSNLWNGAANTTRRGLRYSPVRVDSVGAGYSVYPAAVHFTPAGDTVGVWLPISLAGAGPASRSFSSQFSLTDPREMYPNIEDAVWRCIQTMTVRDGMTKTECRLALGAPADVSNGHNGAIIYDLWQYPDGSWLMFEDGLLRAFKLAGTKP